MPKKIAKKPVFLDRVSQKDIRLTKQRYEALAKYHWDNYTYFAHQRALILDDLKNALISSCQSYSFSRWQRVVDYQFSLEPLSTRGSILNFPGGRFNVGTIDLIKFPRFPALYFAEHRDTAYAEKFGLAKGEKQSGLTADDLLLTSDKSVTIFSLSGELSQVLNLNDPNTLSKFFILINKIKLPKNLVYRAQQLNIKPIAEVKNRRQLLESILYPDWRKLPSVFDIPANSQILGQIVHASGIEAILYPSKITGKNCLAIYPENFAQSSSYVEIDDQVPKEVKCKRLDAETYLTFSANR